MLQMKHNYLHVLTFSKFLFAMICIKLHEMSKTCEIKWPLTENIFLIQNDGKEIIRTA